MWKKYCVVIGILTMTSCEEVVELDLQKSEPRLVIEASLLWDINQKENKQIIKLTTTAPFYAEGVSPALGAAVSVIDPNGIEYVFDETEIGIFTYDEIPAVLEGEYELKVYYQEEYYTASAELIPVPRIQYVEQEQNTGLSGEETQFKVYYRDPDGVDNFYLFRYFGSDLSLQIYDDEFTDGNLTFAFFSSEETDPGERVAFEIQGISEKFYNYLYILRSQTGGSNAGPFQTPPTVVRGNILNMTNPEHFPLGFFRLSAKELYPVIVEE